MTWHCWSQRNIVILCTVPGRIRSDAPALPYVVEEYLADDIEPCIWHDTPKRAC
jgi:hypothetical protein